MKKTKNQVLFLVFSMVISFLFFPFRQLNNKQNSFTRENGFVTIEKENPSRNFENPREDSPEFFAKYERLIRTLPGKKAPDYPPNFRVKELLKAFGANNLKSIKLLKAGSNINWTERGPGNVQGRTRAIVVDPKDNAGNTWFVGSVGGGLWKTTDAGNTWQDLTPDLPNLATSTIAVCKSNPNVIYVGTGEGYYNIDAIGGSGIWKSTDGGNLWQQLASTTNPALFKDVMRIVVNPNDPNQVIVATSHNVDSSGTSKILRSTDGGNTWKVVLSSPKGNDIQQVVANPTNFNILYATSYARGVYKSTDAGVSWKYFSSGIDLIHLGRCEMDVSPVNPNKLFLVCDTDGKAVFYFSSNGGNSWQKFVPDKNWLGGQGWYNNVVTADLFDENSCYVGGIDLMKLTVSASLLKVSVITDVYGSYNKSGKGVHPDQHAITLFALDSTLKKSRIIVGNDGGVYYSDDDGLTFSKTGKGMNTSQFYSVDKINGSTQYIGGLQDNGTLLSPGNFNPNRLTGWQRVLGGDGFGVAWNYSNSSLLLASIYSDIIGRSTDGGRSFSEASPPLSSNDYAPFITHISKSNQDPDLIFTYSKLGVWRSGDFAGSWNFIPITSGSYRGSSSFTQVEISLSDPQIVWVASIVGPKDSILVSTDGGFTFLRTNPINNIPRMRASGFATDPTDPNRAYVLFSAAKEPKIFRTTDLGNSWHELSGFGTAGVSSNGFPDVAVYSLLVMPFNTSIIWAGTEIGIFESTDNGISWHPLQSTLPSTAIWQMRIVNDEVVVATHGRGVWTASLPQLSGYEPPKVTLGPELKNVTINKDLISLNVKLRDKYDSTEVLFDNDVFAVIKNTAQTDTVVNVSFHVTKTTRKKIQLISFKNNKQYKSAFYEHYFYYFGSPRKGYATDFSNGAADFQLDGFSISTQKGFSDNALHSPHPYSDNSELTALLTTPIVVARSNAFLNYIDIAIVEPGEDSSKYGDDYFYDYVVVEATKNGANWLPLADGYDSRFDNKWVDYFVNNKSPDSTMFRLHSINLLDTFNPSDTILIRFRLKADEYVNGYGWVVDNLEIQQKLTSVEENNAAPFRFALYQNYPNPFNPTTVIKYSLPAAGIVNLSVYNLLGQKVAELINEKQSAGVHQFNFNASSFSSGVYFYKIKSGNYSAVKKMLLLK